MRQTVLDCYKFTFPSQYHKVYPLLCTVAVSICWVLTVSEKSSAQVNPSQLQTSDYQLGLAEPLPVPQLLVNNRQSQSRSQTLPALPATTGVAAAPIANPKFVQQKPANDLQQLESVFIQQQVTGKAPPVPRSSVAPRVTAGGDTSDLNLGFQGQMNALEPPISSVVAPLPPLDNSSATQEFTAPAAPTFNQVLSSQAAPSPPLANSSATPKSSAPAPTFNQVLSSQAAPLPPLPNLPATPELTAPPAPTFNQQLLSPQTKPSVPSTTPTPITVLPVTQSVTTQQRPQLTSNSLREPSLQFQGVYINQDGDTTARARLTGFYPLSPQTLVGATLDLTSQGSKLDDSRNDGLNVNELYLATSLPGVPNLRFVIGQIDLTSYFDRNSFAKDGASQFFNPVFQTNPALAATGISSRTSLLVNWSVTDNIEAKAAVFSSANKIGDFSLDGFAGEIGIRYGNAIIRGTYASDRDAGVGDSFLESYSIPRGNNQFGPQKDDREESYGLNAEVFIPNLKLGLFGRYGHYENSTLGEGANTYVLGASLLDTFTPDDRLGIAYGRPLSNESLRRGDRPDVLEVYYDFKFLDNLRLGFSVQERDNFSDTVFGIRVKSEFDVTPRRGISQ
ncbi:MULTISPECIES: carbohydrate porin [unclassified Nostoc]|uniref:carbohydrate porin n=1 Tax=unclassified Nostoc TaxID=2593658 RepID=UPI0026104BE8|nr:carbohydrate porin [Nostoc sp. S13]MDF5734907.1 porin [Nostoc sp. S13]